MLKVGRKLEVGSVVEGARLARGFEVSILGVESKGRRVVYAVGR